MQSILNEIKSMRARNGGSMEDIKKDNEEVKVKLKKAQDVTKRKSKQLEEVEVRVNELNVKLGGEVNGRAKAEAERVKAGKLCDHF